MIYAVLSNFDFVAKFTVKNLNKDFINAVRGGVTVLWKYFIKKNGNFWTMASLNMNWLLTRTYIFTKSWILNILSERHILSLYVLEDAFFSTHFASCSSSSFWILTTWNHVLAFLQHRLNLLFNFCHSGWKCNCWKTTILLESILKKSLNFFSFLFCHLSRNGQNVAS